MIDEIVTMIDGVEVVLDVEKVTPEELKEWTEISRYSSLTLKYRSSTGRNVTLRKCNLQWDGERAVVEWDNERVGGYRPGERGYSTNMQSTFLITLKPEQIISIEREPG